MKSPSDRTKVVLRHLPPAMSEAALVEQIDAAFAGRYNWVQFCAGKNSRKNQWHSRAYIDFKIAEDVVKFAEFFHGHVFVNEKGAQFKTIVEYAPSQRVPKASSKKDGREGAIFKDHDYLEFLEHITKPIENLPSAEIQLERREAERAGLPKRTLIVTPLMEYIRQKRAAKSLSQRPVNGKISRRAGGASPIRSSLPSRRGFEKQRGQTCMYVVKDSTKITSGKEKSKYILMPRREEQIHLDKSLSVASASGTHTVEDDKVSGGTDSGKRIVLLKAKEKEISHAFGGSSEQQNLPSLVKNSQAPAPLKQSQRNDVSGRIIRSILSNKDISCSRSNSASAQSEQPKLAPNFGKDKLPPRSPNICAIPRDLATGAYQPVGRQGVPGLKEFDSYRNFSEGKPFKRRGPFGYGSHELHMQRQVWVQKSGSAS